MEWLRLGPLQPPGIRGQVVLNGSMPGPGLLGPWSAATMAMKFSGGMSSRTLWLRTPRPQGPHAWPGGIGPPISDPDFLECFRREQQEQPELPWEPLGAPEVLGNSALEPAETRGTMRLARGPRGLRPARCLKARPSLTIFPRERARASSKTGYTRERLPDGAVLWMV